MKYSVPAGAALLCSSLMFVPDAHSQQKPVSLEPVIVTATRQEDEALKVPAHITVITQEDIAMSGADDVGDLLRDQAGLSVVNTSGSAPTGIILDGRGFNNGGGNGSRMLILIDGRRANQADTSNPDWAAIPLESIDRIEITRGSASALYGDNAMAGVINIMTKTGQAEAPFKGTLEAGSYNSRGRRLALSGDQGTLSYYLYGGHDSTDGYRDNSDYRASNYVGSLTYRKSESSKLLFRGSYMGYDRKLPGALTEEELEDVGREGSVADDQGGVHQAQFDAVFDSKLSDNIGMELSGGQTLRAGQTSVTFPGSGASDLGSESRSSALFGKYRVSGRLAGRDNRLMLGVDAHKERVTSDSSNDFPDPMFPFITTEETTYERRLLGAYAHDDLSLSPSFLLTLSGRMDWSKFRYAREETDEVADVTTRSSGDRFFRVWSPKVGLVYHSSPIASVFATWSRSFRFPNRDELTGIFGITPELDPERATTLEFGSQASFPGILQSSVSVFQMTVEDEILFVPPDAGEFAFGENQNVPEVQHEGMEATLMTRYQKSLRVRGSYTVTRTKIEKGPFKGGDLPMTPKHAGSLAVDIGNPKGLLLTVSGRFVGGRILANDLANEQEKLPKYTVYDARLSYVTTGLELFFGVRNLFDRKYDEFAGVGGFPFGSRVGVNPSPERNYAGGATLTF
jgi:iron complex outermembrane recepter protein